MPAHIVLRRIQHPFCGIPAKKAQPETNHGKADKSKCPEGHSTKVTAHTL